MLANRRWKCLLWTNSNVDQDNKLVEDIEEAKKDIEDQLNQEPPAEGEEAPPQPKFKRVRHGLGINCYGRTEGEDILCKYEGRWDRDKKSGEGFLVFPDGSTYRGNFKNDIIDGFGTFHWDYKGHTYEGNWKGGCLEGEGKFTHAEGNQFTAEFYNNYKISNNLFVNPFLSVNEEEEYQQK